MDVDIFADALDTGIVALREHNFDIILMNMQYSQTTDSVIDFAPYLEAMERRADFDDVYLFRRFEMMRYWSENGIFDFADVPAPGRRNRFRRPMTSSAPDQRSPRNASQGGF